MEHKLIFILLTHLLPAASNLVCCVVIWLDVMITPTQRERELKIWLFAFFFTDFFIWLNLLFQSFFPHIFYYTHLLWYFALLVNPIFMYAVVRILTPSFKARIAIGWHFVIPAFIVLISAICLIFMPKEEIMGLLVNKDTEIKSFGGYLIHFNTKVTLELIYSFIYIFASLSILLFFRKKVRKEEDKNSMRTIKWMNLLFPCCIVVLLLPSEAIFFAQESFFRTLILFCWVLLLAAIHIRVCINIINRHNPVATTFIKSAPLELSFSLDEKDETTTIQSASKQDSPDRNKTQIREVDVRALQSEDIIVTSQQNQERYEKFEKKITKRSFDAWFARNKPYLDPELKMEDLLEPLGMNRTQLSGFVNRNYGMSFVNYVSGWRLKELDKLRAIPRNRSVTLLSLLPQAGFGSHQSYRRAQDFHANLKQD